jgi:AbrB family looped-hinge helix DNA binding protein
MAVTTVTSKGQVTIPSEVRRALDIRAGDHLIMTVDGDSIVVTPVPNRKASDLYGEMRSDRSFPGTREVRGEVGKHLGRRRDRR